MISTSQWRKLYISALQQPVSMHAIHVRLETPSLAFHFTLLSLLLVYGLILVHVSQCQLEVSITSDIVENQTQVQILFAYLYIRQSWCQIWAISLKKDLLYSCCGYNTSLTLYRGVERAPGARSCIYFGAGRAIGIPLKALTRAFQLTFKASKRIVTKISTQQSWWLLLH